MSEQSFENVLSSIMGNEALMGKISSIMSSHNGDKDEALPEVIEAISASMGDKKSDDGDSKNEKTSVPVSKRGGGRNDLLLALRPYLSEKRAKMIDQLLKMDQLAEIIKLTR